MAASGWPASISSRAVWSRCSTSLVSCWRARFSAAWVCSMVARVSGSAGGGWSAGGGVVAGAWPGTGAAGGVGAAVRLLQGDLHHRLLSASCCLLQALGRQLVVRVELQGLLEERLRGRRRALGERLAAQVGQLLGQGRDRHRRGRKHRAAAGHPASRTRHLSTVGRFGTCSVLSSRRNEVLPGFVSVQIPRSEPSVYRAWEIAAGFSRRGDPWDAGPAGPRSPAPKPLSSFSVPSDNAAQRSRSWLPSPPARSRRCVTSLSSLDSRLSPTPRGSNASASIPSSRRSISGSAHRRNAIFICPGCGTRSPR